MAREAAAAHRHQRPCRRSSEKSGASDRGTRRTRGGSATTAHGTPLGTPGQRRGKAGQTQMGPVKATSHWPRRAPGGFSLLTRGTGQQKAVQGTEGKTSLGVSTKSTRERRGK